VSSVASPIVVDGRLWGVITVTSESEVLPPDTQERLEKFTELVATAISNAESREHIHRLAEEQAALRRVATLVAGGIATEDVFAAVASEVGHLFGSDVSAIVRFEDAGVVTVLGDIGGPHMAGARVVLDPGYVVDQVRVTSASARYDTDDPSAPDAPSIVRSLGIRSALASPIVVEGELWGAITAASRDSSLGSHAEQRLNEFTELVATAIANAESRAALAQLVDEQTALRRLATLVAEGVSSGDLFSALTKEVAQAFSDGDATLVASVIRFDPGPESVLVGASRAYAHEPLGSRWAPKELYVSTRVLRTGRPARVDEADLDEVGGPDADLLRLREFLYQVGSPVVVEGELWGAMCLNSSRELPPDTDVRLASFVELIATAIANAESRSELAASRRRIVAASDEARRRIERDLHDGTQQRLVSLALVARSAEAELPPESSVVREKLATIASGLGDAVADLQELSRGIHPAILSDAGLPPALEALALRSPIPVELDVRTRKRFPEQVEVGAYFVASESLANAAKHSEASRIEVLLAVEDERLLLAVRDDGIGGADPGRGSGLVGVRDRVEALGGTITIESHAGAGTSLTVRLPLVDEPSSEGLLDS
jgi:signal transduction histidine kinase